MRPIDYAAPYASARSPVMGRDTIATSHPLASQAGMAMLTAGGSAVDAIVAAAMTLTVVEPTGCGIGSDAFAILWDGTTLRGLNSSGRAPAAWSADRFAGRTAIPERGWDSVSVPGAVAGWIALHEKYGRLPLAQVAAPAIRFAREGFALTPIIAAQWASGAALLARQPGFAECFMPGGRAPKAGEIFRSEAHARTLEEIVETGGKSFYEGRLAETMAADAKAHGGAMTAEDLGRHSADWVDTISMPFADAVVHELPPNGQGIATLMGLGMLASHDVLSRGVDDPMTVHLAIEATKLALVDLAEHVADIDHMNVRPEALLDASYLAERARMIDPERAGDPGHGAPRRGGTVCLSAADRNGMMISFIQSNYMGFGSGVVVPGTGISLQNRAVGFNLRAGHPNMALGGKRPFHTIIPGFATDADGAPRMAFGLMGGPMQAQGHLQLALRIFGYGQNPQAAADAPRWRVIAGRQVVVESGMKPSLVEALRAKGHDVLVEQQDSAAAWSFGGAQIVIKAEDGYVAGSDPRKDGHALAW